MQDPNNQSFRAELNQKNIQLAEALARLKVYPEYMAYEQWLQDTLNWMRDVLEVAPAEQVPIIQMAIKTYRDLLDGPAPAITESTTK